MTDFFKYHGTGNDFILIDDRISNLQLRTNAIRKLCDRHFGIGGDGLILIRKSNDSDFEMLYYNSDGLPGSMCGNGGRCAVAFAHSLGLVKDATKFKAFDGIHEAKIISTDPMVIKLKMNDVKGIEMNNDFIFLNTGSPHYIKFANAVADIDIIREGRSVRYNDRFRKEGTNVNFVEVNGDSLFIRTYERGVEDETLSCGTGVTASVIAAAKSGKNISSGSRVNTPGGELRVYFKENNEVFQDIWLEGEARPVFSGAIDLEKVVD